MEVTRNSYDLENDAFIYEDNENCKNSFKINNILCLGSGYVGVLTMSVLANYYPKIKIQIFDTFKEILNRWIESGRKLKEENNNNHKLPIVEKNFDILFKKTFENNLFFN